MRLLSLLALSIVALAAGRLAADHPEWPEVQQTAARLSATIAEHTGRAA